MLKDLYAYLFIDDLINQSANPVGNIRATVKQKLLCDLAWATLFAYVSLIFNPVNPIISDKMAHTFWKEYHMVTVHHIYGNAHVNTEIDKAAKQTQKDKAAKSSLEEYSHLITTISYNFSSNNFTSRSYIPYKLRFPVSFSNIHYLPPKVS